MKMGKFDAANGGTIFLDEIGDMSLKTQAKILRVLQEQSFTRVGGGENVEVDVRVIAATNKNLQQEIANGQFREDLYFRLNVIPFHILPLRDRKSDIPLFIQCFLSELTLDTGKYSKGVTDKALLLLQDYSWPGNVRELKNLLERLIIMSPGDYITDADLPDYIRVKDNRFGDDSRSPASLKRARENFEKDFILRKLEENRWNISKTANVIGVERTSLYRKIKNYNINVESR
jgi:two-component system nitrogen regulation response regulator NtrX